MSSRIDRNANSSNRKRRNFQRLAEETANPAIRLNGSSTNAIQYTATGYGVFVDNTTITLTSTGLLQAAGSVGLLDASIFLSTTPTGPYIRVQHSSTGGTSTNAEGIGIKLAATQVPITSLVTSTTWTYLAAASSTFHVVYQRLAVNLTSTSTDIPYVANQTTLSANFNGGNNRGYLWQGSTMLGSTAVLTASTLNSLAISTAAGSTSLIINGSTLVGPIAINSTTNALCGWAIGKGGAAGVSNPVTSFSNAIGSTTVTSEAFPGNMTPTSTYVPPAATLTTQRKWWRAGRTATSLIYTQSPATSYTSYLNQDQATVSTNGIVNNNSGLGNYVVQFYTYMPDLFSGSTFNQMPGLSTGAAGLTALVDNTSIGINPLGQLYKI